MRDALRRAYWAWGRQWWWAGCFTIAWLLGLGLIMWRTM